MGSREAHGWSRSSEPLTQSSRRAQLTGREPTRPQLGRGSLVLHGGPGQGRAVTTPCLVALIVLGTWEDFGKTADLHGCIW